ncbi:MAG: hypothetical protein WAW06_07275 [bacterium]
MVGKTFVGKRASGMVARRSGVAAIWVVLATAAVLALTLGLGLAARSEAADSTATEVIINEHGIRINDRQVAPGEADSMSSLPGGKYRVSRDGAVRIVHSDNDVVRFGDDVIVEEGEVVEGDAVAIFGSVLVNGVVEGDAVAVGGAVTVGPRGRVDGDGVAIGGGVSREAGGEVRGETVSIGKGGDWAGEWVNGRYMRHHGFPWGFFSRGGRLLIWIVWSAVLVLLALLVLAVARRPVENVCAKARSEAFKMGLIGLAAWLLVGPAIVLFLITIIGIPIGLVVIPLLFALALLLGYTGVGLAVGERIGGSSGRSAYFNLALGIIALQGVTIIAGIMRIPGSWLGIMGWIVGVVGWAVIFVASTVGLGAVIMTKFGTAGPKVTPPAGVAAPQPPPSI